MVAPCMCTGGTNVTWASFHLDKGPLGLLSWAVNFPPGQTAPAPRHIEGEASGPGSMSEHLKTFILVPHSSPRSVSLVIYIQYEKTWQTENLLFLFFSSFVCTTEVVSPPHLYFNKVSYSQEFLPEHLFLG